MEALMRMKEALDWLERRMEERLDIEEMARTATMSPFHFQRMFHMLTGVTIAEYVRRRKLTLAAQELAATSGKVLDVALKYGYDTPESFAKAFRRLHGISPSEARQPGVSLKAYPRISFHLSLKGDKEMDYRMEDKAAFPVIGRSRRMTCEGGSNLRDIPAFWGECEQDGTLAALGAASRTGTLLGVCLDMQPGQGDFTYLIGCESEASAAPAGCETRTIAAYTWAIFAAVGTLPESIQSTIGRIYQEWFSATGYEHAGGPELEVYPPGDTTATDYRCEVWVPVVKK
ncbi:AraC family transcriptional regulator [Paenibacillus cymbidii]|uniref:AraC family transcriptional regulator n=1 Tax=Paenibacillus cymbidii TaxID=1639034 RepID=UPI001A9B844A|nr:AraC family transcriptional regulator [Paenibacillus cymbidii]